jgi:hypothetical protein
VDLPKTSTEPQISNQLALTTLSKHSTLSSRSVLSFDFSLRQWSSWNRHWYFAPEKHSSRPCNRLIRVLVACNPAHRFSSQLLFQSSTRVPRLKRRHVRGTVHVHSHCATCLKMYISIVLATLLCHTTTSKAAVIPQYSKSTMSSTTTGFKNVAYFVNWVGQFTVDTPPTSYYHELSLIREFTGATTIPKIYQHRSSPMFSMPLQMSGQNLVKCI